jgi:hypothetical protein
MNFAPNADVFPVCGHPGIYFSYDVLRISSPGIRPFIVVALRDDVTCRRNADDAVADQGTLSFLLVVMPEQDDMDKW